MRSRLGFGPARRRASTGWFVSSELLGNKKVKLYDGSMVEWTIIKAGPVEQKVKI